MNINNESPSYVHLMKIIILIFVCVATCDSHAPTHITSLEKIYKNSIKLSG